jgi:thymidylate synthase
MAAIDINFNTLCQEILDKGVEYNNTRRGVKRLQIPSYTFKHSFEDGFPAITSKKLYWKGIVTELIWFLRGDNDVEFLNKHGVKIWNKDAYNWYVKKGGHQTFEEFEAIGKGSVGQNYSAQWRNYNDKTDQIKDLIEGMKKDIMSSRLKVNAWNPSEINKTALPPCHSEFQVIGVPLPDGEFGFELHWNQRSVDTFLGLPFNIASYGLLAKILEEVTGYKALGIEVTLKCVHFYDNQIEAVKELLKRDTEKHGNCEVEIQGIKKGYNSTPLGLEVFHYIRPQDFKLINYTHEKPIKVDMLAPKSV